VTRWSQFRRGRPWRVLSEITCASEVAPRAAFPQYGVWVIRGNGLLPLINPCRGDSRRIMTTCVNGPSLELRRGVLSCTGN
jgi:hypothetical protein